jgi:uncharacterized protein (TIGR02246 family)
MNAENMNAESINAFIAKMQDIWNAGDEKAWARCFAKDVDFVNLFGGYHHSRDKIEASHNHLFTGVFKGSHNVFTVEKVRFLRPDLAAVLVFTALDFKAGHYDGRMTFLMEEQDGDLQIVWFQNTMVTKPAHHGDHARAETVNPDYKPMGA